MPALKVHLVIIDPQIDFMGEDGLDANGLPRPYTISVDGEDYKASLAVPYATSDMKRLAAMIDRTSARLDDIHVTLDSHQAIDISHPGMWRNKDGDMPAPFTMITAADMDNGIWTARDPGSRQRLRAYLEKLSQTGQNGRLHYDHMIWPEHCLIGTVGHNVYPPLMEALNRWCRSCLGNIDWVAKGTNVFTEHFGGLEAEVPDPTDNSTQLNGRFLDILRSADMIAIGGEAASHCVLSTVRQIADNIGDDHLRKIYLLTDAMSPVLHPVVDFPAITKAFQADMETRGLNLTTTDKFLA